MGSDRIRADETREVGQGTLVRRETMLGIASLSALTSSTAGSKIESIVNAAAAITTTRVLSSLSLTIARR